MSNKTFNNSTTPPSSSLSSITNEIYIDNRESRYIQPDFGTSNEYELSTITDEADKLDEYNLIHEGFLPSDDVPQEELIHSDSNQNDPMEQQQFFDSESLLNEYVWVDDESDEDIWSDTSESSDNTSDESTDNEEETVDPSIYNGSSMNVSTFSFLLMIYAIKHNLSNKAIKNLLKLFALVLPQDSRCPTSLHNLQKVTRKYSHSNQHYELCKHCHCNIVENNCVNENCGAEIQNAADNLCFYTFDIKEQLQRILSENYNDITAYKEKFSTSSYQDIVDGTCYQSKLSSENYATIVWHIDGAPPIKSKNMQIWLITAFLVELPISIRYTLKNILFCGLWYGKHKPDFDLFQLNFVRQIKTLRDNGFFVNVKDTQYHFTLNIEAGLADLPARAASLKFKQFNGKFGCPTCYHPGQKLTVGSLVWIYPYQQITERAANRTHADVLYHAVAAEEHDTIVFGIKGVSPLLQIMQIPDEIPFDYMHLVVEGEFRRKLVKHFLIKHGLISDESLDRINTSMKNILYPHDFQKKANVLSESSVKNAKAGELQLLLLHVLLPLIKNHIPDDVFCHFGLFVTAVQILNKDSVSEDEINIAEIMLEQYHLLNATLYGDQSQTFTNHALIHLASQRKTHGCPLILLSNFVFESFIGVLKKQFHGTRNIIGQMVTNIGILQKIYLLAEQTSCKSDIKTFVDQIIDSRLLSVRYKFDENTFICGNTYKQIPVFRDFEISLTLLNTLPNNIQISERLWYKHQMYHSLSYKYKRMSNSYTVSYMKQDRTIGFGEVLFFAFNSTDCFVAIKVFKILENSLYEEDLCGLLNDTVDQLIMQKYLGCGFSMVSKTDEIILQEHYNLNTRVIFVPISESTGYVSNVLSSYQHD